MPKKFRKTAAALPSLGRPADAAQLSRDSFSDAVLSALISSPEIDETLRRAGIARHQLRRLMGDDEIMAALDTRRAAAESTPWRLEGYDQTPAMQHLSDNLNACMEPLVHAIWDAVPMGYSVCEVVWRPSPSGAGVDMARVHRLPMERFTPQIDGSLRGVLPGVGYEQPLDNTYKFFETVREPSIEAPSGVALLAPLYWPWHFRQHGWRYWMQFVERFGTPIVTGQVNDPAGFVNAMSGLGINTAIGVGPTDQVGIVSASGAGEFQQLEQALCKRIQKLILGQTLTSDVTGGGSYATAKVQDGVRNERKAADLRLLRKTIQRIVNAFWALNRYGGPAPLFLLEDAKGIEAERAKRDAQLVQTGVLRLTEQYLLTHYDFEPGDFTLDGLTPTPPAEPNPPSAPAGEDPEDPEAPADRATAQLSPGPRASAQLSPGRALQFTPGQQVVEDLTDRALQDAGSPLDAKAIRAAIEASSSPEELADRLADLIPQASSAAFSAAMERALFAADVLGWGNAERRRF